MPHGIRPLNSWVYACLKANLNASFTQSYYWM